jgi:hypothetical protein
MGFGRSKGGGQASLRVRLLPITNRFRKYILAAHLFQFLVMANTHSQYLLLVEDIRTLPLDMPRQTLAEKVEELHIIQEEDSDGQDDSPSARGRQKDTSDEDFWTTTSKHRSFSKSPSVASSTSPLAAYLLAQRIPLPAQESPKTLRSSSHDDRGEVPGWRMKDQSSPTKVKGWEQKEWSTMTDAEEVTVEEEKTWKPWNSDKGLTKSSTEDLTTIDYPRSPYLPQWTRPDSGFEGHLEAHSKNKTKHRRQNDESRLRRTLPPKVRFAEPDDSPITQQSHPKSILPHPTPFRHLVSPGTHPKTPPKPSPFAAILNQENTDPPYEIRDLRDELTTRLVQMEERLVKSIDDIKMDRNHFRELKMRIGIYEEERQRLGRDITRLQLGNAVLQAHVKAMEDEKEREEKNVGEQEDYSHWQSPQ